MKRARYVLALLTFAAQAAQDCETRLSRDVRHDLSQQVQVVSEWVWEGLLPPAWTAERVAKALRRMPPLPDEALRQQSVLEMRHSLLNEVARRWGGAEDFATVFFRRRYGDYFKCYTAAGEAYFVHPAAGMIYVGSRAKLDQLQGDTVLRQAWEDGRYQVSLVRGHVVMKLRKRLPGDAWQKIGDVPEPLQGPIRTARVELLQLWPDGAGLLKRCDAERPQRVQCWGRGSVLLRRP